MTATTVRGVKEVGESPGTLSVVVVAHDMVRELPRTLRSLSPGHQVGLAADDYEVIVVDNGSSPPVDPAIVEQFDGTLRVERLDPAPPSPAHAANVGLGRAAGDLVGLIVDGARLASPGLLAGARRAARLADRPLITAPAFHLGEVRHMQAAEVGYDQAVEDQLLRGIRVGGRWLPPLRGEHTGGVIGSRVVRAHGRVQQPVLLAHVVEGAGWSR